MIKQRQAADCVKLSCEGLSYVVVFLWDLFFCLWKMKMRSDESSWETWGLLETPKQWRGQGGTYYFSFSSYSPHFSSIIHPTTTRQLSAFPSSNSLKVSDAPRLHNAQMLSFSPSTAPPPQPRAIIHNLFCGAGSERGGIREKRGERRATWQLI